ncbi:5-formyltetrahydrofolate cyclo-ligase [Betaproteobacteria bacterium SCN1]|jgi:5-formyltetrahydrofolate cyclo-ligase|nr:5-formyltetrahydrofolate cyclo-ligase [Betaproteobacteria bacterium SCN1]
MNKSTLRRQLRAARNAVDPRARKLAAHAAMRLILRDGTLLRARRIGFYLPHRGEFDLRPLIRRAQTMGRVCCLPILPRRGRIMRFGQLAADRPHLRPNRFGIPEPAGTTVFRARQLDLLLMPLVGFDTAGHRLGMGGGFYDATLAYMRQRRHWRKPRLIGVAFECQRVTALPHDPWDMPLDAVLTEKRLYRFRAGQ